MLINTDQVLKMIDGTDMKDTDDKGELVDAMFSVCVTNALLAPKKDDSGQKKYDKYELARKFNQGGEIEITTDEAKVIKDEVGRVFPPAIVGSVYDIIEGKN